MIACKVSGHLLSRAIALFVLLLGLVLTVADVARADVEAFLATHCSSCHDKTTKAGGLDLMALGRDMAAGDAFPLWLKIHDRLAAGEMPPRGQPQPKSEERRDAVRVLAERLLDAERKRLQEAGAPGLRRLTRTEFENTVRDLFDMPGIALAGELPADGMAYGFDKNSDALDISHVNLTKYLAAADHILDYAIATRPQAPTVQKRRISLCNSGGFVAHVVLNGDGILLVDKKVDPEFPPSGEQGHIDEGAHERMGTFERGSSVGLFRHEDESLSPYFIDHVTIYPGRYRVRTSLFAFQWDKGQVLPARGTEAARLSVVQLTGDGRGGQHPSYVLGYFDAPSLKSQEHELITWLNHNELIGFNTASLAPQANYYKKKRAMEFTGPGIAVDWLDIEGPLHETWPPVSHRRLFGNLPLVKWEGAANGDRRAPTRKQVRQLSGKNRPDPDPGLHTVHSEQPIADAARLLADFLPRAFRRAVAREVLDDYQKLFAARWEAGDSFEASLRYAYRAALCSPDFLYHVEPSDTLDDAALACRLSYFLWNSLPDERLVQLAQQGELNRPEVLAGEVERLLRDPKSQRFIDDFLGQWLKLRQIAANDPDKKLYPEFNPYLQDSMVAETRAFFRELLEKNLDASHLVRSNFVMINQKLADHYGISGVSGSQIRRVALPNDCPRGGFLTQASILKITANGTTTSPVPRGAFVMDRLLGQPPEPPPANVAAVEPDVRGTTTIREQLAKHRAHVACASCHAKLDPPGFALESFDVIGGYRTRYRSIGEGLPPERGRIDPAIGLGFKLGPEVDASGALADERAFRDVTEFQALIAANPRPLLENLAKQLTVYATGRPIRFSDRAALDSVVAATAKQGGGIRTLIQELAQSSLFRRK